MHWCFTKMHSDLSLKPHYISFKMIYEMYFSWYHKKDMKWFLNYHLHEFSHVWKTFYMSKNVNEDELVTWTIARAFERYLCYENTFREVTWYRSACKKGPWATFVAMFCTISKIMVSCNELLFMSTLMCQQMQIASKHIFSHTVKM